MAIGTGPAAAGRRPHEVLGALTMEPEHWQAAAGGVHTTKALTASEWQESREKCLLALSTPLLLRTYTSVPLAGPGLCVPVVQGRALQ